MPRTLPLTAATAALLALAAPARATSPNILFFGSGSARLDALDERLLDAAIIWLREVGATRIRIDGAADRDGSAAANRRLSRRRAEAVRDALVRRGFPAGAIAIRAFGEDRPLLETPDGVADMNNRYVYIGIEEAAPAR